MSDRAQDPTLSDEAATVLKLLRAVRHDVEDWRDGVAGFAEAATEELKQIQALSLASPEERDGVKALVDAATGKKNEWFQLANSAVARLLESPQYLTIRSLKVHPLGEGGWNRLCREKREVETLFNGLEPHLNACAEAAKTAIRNDLEPPTPVSWEWMEPLLRAFETADGKLLGGRVAVSDTAVDEAWLGISLNDESHTVRRKGIDHKADFQGSVIRWEFFRATFNKNGDILSYQSVYKLWNEFGSGEPSTRETIRVESSKINRLINKLDLDLKAIRNLGYKLRDLRLPDDAQEKS
jgi:hypothetical protein